MFHPYKEILGYTVKKQFLPHSVNRYRKINSMPHTKKWTPMKKMLQYFNNIGCKKNVAGSGREKSVFLKNC